MGCGLAGLCKGCRQAPQLCKGQSQAPPSRRLGCEPHHNPAGGGGGLQNIPSARSAKVGLPGRRCLGHRLPRMHAPQPREHLLERRLIRAARDPQVELAENIILRNHDAVRPSHLNGEAPSHKYSVPM